MDIFENIAQVVIEGDKEKVAEVINKALAQKMEPLDIIQKGLTHGLHVVGQMFENMELYLPEMMLSADVMKKGIELVKPHIEEKQIQKEGIIVIGTIQGDVHDIGKNIVTSFLEVNGFNVYDLGLDVPAHTFVDSAEEKHADIIGISGLLTSTMTYMPDVIDELKRRGLRQKYLVMVGGSALTPEWAHEIEADGYGRDFLEAVKVAKQLMLTNRRTVN